MLCPLPPSPGDAKVLGGLGRAGQGTEPLTRPLCTDMEVLYWRHVREQLETLQKLRRREASTGPGGPHTAPGVGDGSGLTVSAQVAEQWLPRAEEGLWPAEEDRLEDSLEELGEAGGGRWGGAGR